MRAHVVSDVPVAAFTSGGVDSNLVAAIAREARPDLVAYTMDSGGPESELAAATLAARHLDLPLRPVHVDRAAFLRAWPEAVEREEFPSAHESHVAALVLARAARADGIAVALTGEGADEALRRVRLLLPHVPAVGPRDATVVARGPTPGGRAVASSRPCPSATRRCGANASRTPASSRS